MRKLMNFFATFSLLLASGAVLSLAHAQAAPQGQAAPETNFSDSQKDAFVSAYAEVNAIQQEYQAQINPEMDEAEMQAKATEANERIEAAIDGQSNMDTDTYRQILVALETDQELLNEIQEKLQSQGM